jgi:threonine dehydratase
MLNKILKTPIYNILQKTDLTKSNNLSNLYKNNIYLKREDKQPINSFKIRGAYQKIFSLNSQELKNGLVTASAGNHAQGVALSANYLNTKATIVMPIVTPSIKYKAVEALNADIILKGNTYDEAFNYALELSEKYNYTFIHPFDNEDIIAGQGTVALEIDEQLDICENKEYIIFVPVGGGGLISGISYYMKMKYSNVKIIGVEPIGANSLTKSLKANKIITLNNLDTFADGVAVKTIGKLPFEYCKKYVDDVIECSTDEICQAIQIIFEENRSIVEPAGALSLAGLIKYININNCKNLEMISILSGANLNFSRLRYISERSNIHEILLSVKIPEKSGSLRTFCKLLNSPDITEFNYRYSDNNIANIFVGINTEDKQNILTILNKNNYELIDLSNNEVAKTHVRYQVGGKTNLLNNEVIYNFEFPERNGALLHFLNNLMEVSDNKWNITMFHYKNCGSSIANVLCGFNIPINSDINTFLQKLNYNYTNETNNIAIKLFC